MPGAHNRSQRPASRLFEDRIQGDSLCNRFWGCFGQGFSVCPVPGGGLPSEPHTSAHGSTSTGGCYGPIRRFPRKLRRSSNRVENLNERREHRKAKGISSTRCQTDEPTR